MFVRAIRRTMSLLSFSLRGQGILAVWSSDPYEDEILLFDTDDMNSNQVATLSIKNLEDTTDPDSVLAVFLNGKTFIAESLLFKIRESREITNSKN